MTDVEPVHVGPAAANAAERSPSVQRTRLRTPQHTQAVVDAARRLISEKGERFTIQEVAKEAGVALQTFYRSFASKDELLLAVIEDMVLQACSRFEASVQGVVDPVERLRSHVASVLTVVADADDGGAAARFVVSNRTRLTQLFPEMGLRITKAFADLLEPEIAAATTSGQLRSTDPAEDAWFITQLVLAMFQQSAFGPTQDGPLVDHVWRFCLRGLCVAEAGGA